MVIYNPNILYITLLVHHVENFIKPQVNDVLDEQNFAKLLPALKLTVSGRLFKSAFKR